ncbi:unnamed protein product [Calicophoron daubneyi]|uniref:SGNH hydrolase-type esterase domain-containing protein n=1 Tax=Calicophoron daubneyi TaxID=300641 RepID=A0AAV2TYB6_CALDB
MAGKVTSQIIPKVIFLGDSITQLGWSYDGGWLSILASNFVRKLDVIGRGFSGYNTRMCKPLVPLLFPNSASVENCRMLSIFFGANDASIAEQHVPVEEFKTNLQWMIQYFQGLGLPTKSLMIISLPPVDEARYGGRQIAEGLPVSRLLKNCVIYANAAKEVAGAAKVTFVNIFEAMVAQKNWPELLIDGLHFSRKGSEFVADILTNILTTRLAADCADIAFPYWKDLDRENPQHSIDNYMKSLASKASEGEQ